MAKIDEQEFNYQARRYVKRLMYKGLDVATFKRYVREDLKDEEQAQELIEDVLDAYGAALDVLLQEMLDVLDYKEKFAIVGNDIITAYPHPIVENRNVVGVEYKPHKSYTFTDDELFNRYIKMLDDKEKAEQFERKISDPQYVAKNVAMISEMQQSGITYKELAEIFKASPKKISSYVRNYRKEQAAATL